MRALEILRKSELETNCGTLYSDGGAPIATEKEIEEAIAELEALQAPKTCDGCKNCDQNMWCTFFANGTTVQPNFSCAGYEPKETL